jgi:hypothetical protein
VVSAATMPQWPYLKTRDPDNVAPRAPLAQLAEQLTLNQRVGGSIPSRRTFLLVRGTLVLEAELLAHTLPTVITLNTGRSRPSQAF